ncbi:MAG TPA: M23 family metallopeptidase [Candidatus Bathyarchaeia archaeon]|nr:M23 family metallopeptidase [Candidatus Bathyarchaeia archaeon]
MLRKSKIILGISLTIIIIGAGIGSVLLWWYWPGNSSQEAPVFDFPVENIDVIHILGGYGNTSWGSFHYGIDFGCNASVNILAACDLRVTAIQTWMYTTDPDRWQTSVLLEINQAYGLNIAFESWALNETYANLQRDAIVVELDQIVLRGQVLGQLLYHGEGTHIDFMLIKQGSPVCPYPYFSDSAKNLFDSLWIKYGTPTSICNETAT